MANAIHRAVIAFLIARMPQLEPQTETVVIEALIFDCDGTLTDSMFAHFSAWRDALKPQGMFLDEQEFYRHSGTPSSRVIPMLAQEQNVEIDFRRALAEKEGLFADKIGLIKPVESVVQIAREHRGKIPMAVASGGTRRLVDMQLQQINITDWFETCLLYTSPSPRD